MTETQAGFTPEPWDFEDVVNPHMITAGKSDAGAFRYIATMEGLGIPDSEDDANARLIIQAPRLYKALKAMLAIEYITSGFFDADFQTMEDAKDALAAVVDLGTTPD